MAGIAFVAGLIVFGVIYSFGVLLDPLMAEFSTNRAEASAYYAIASLAFYMLGPITGYMGDRLGPRMMTVIGALAMGGGLVATGFIDRLWIGYLTYGLGVGLGAACAYVPTFANVGAWFDRRRTMALGIAATGTGCGMLVIPPFLAVLVEAMGWRHAVIVLGGISGLLLLACAALVMPPAMPSDQQEPQSFARSLAPIVRSTNFQLLYVSWLLATTALFVPLVLLPAFAMRQGVDAVAASGLISVLGGASIAGRLGIGFLAEKFGALRLFNGATLGMGLSYLIWHIFPGYTWLVIFAIVLGVAYGVRIALVAPILITFFGVKNLGAVLGIFFTATGIAALTGPLLASAIIDASGSFQPAILAAVAAGGMGFVVLLALRRT
jgi:MFS family permease